MKYFITLPKIDEDDEGNGQVEPNDPMYLANKDWIYQIKTTDPKFNGELEDFKNNYNAKKELYTRIAKELGLPPEVVAVIHWRESSADFNTYLYQGDPLGKPAVNWPNNIPAFYDFDEAAIHALTYDKYRNQQKDALKIDDNSTNFVATMTYLEVYNGAGYI